MLGRGAVILGALAALMACVDDQTVDVSSLKDAGRASSSSSSGDAGGAHPPGPRSCGDLTQNDHPTCPGEANDPSCGYDENAGKNFCCAGNACSATASCASNAPLFECFSSGHCGGAGCCVPVAPVLGKDPDCNERATIALPPGAGSVCNCAPAGSVRLCKDDGECGGKSCTRVRIVIPNPNQTGDYVRVVKACL